MKRILLAASFSLSVGMVQAQLNYQPFFTQLGDLCTGGCNTAPQYLTNCNGTIYFAGNIDTAGYELCSSDGTPTGTRLIKNIAPGTLGSAPKGFTAVNGKVIFMANDGTHGYEPWITDGTAAGTKLLKDINPGAVGQTAEAFTVMGNKAYFSATDDTHGTELWVSDGTAAGTQLLLDIDPTASSYPSASMAVYNGKLYFSATTNSDRELWVTDGTAAGTQLLTDINLLGASGPDNFTIYNGKLYFSAYPNNTSGGELFATDGTPSGTQLITDIGTAGDSLPRALIVANNLLFFAAGTPLDSQTVWVTDGTPNAELKLATLSTSYANRKLKMLDNDGKLYFIGAQPGHSLQDVLWQTDGTIAGTKVVDATLLSPGEMVSLKNEVYFICNNKLYNTPNTINVQEVPPPVGANGTIQNEPMVVMGDALYFSSEYQTFYGIELWKMEVVPVSVSTLNSNNDVTIYPNPANNTFSVKTDQNKNTTIKIYSLTGRLLLQTQQTENINIENLPAGTYIVQVFTNGKTSIKQLVKE